MPYGDGTGPNGQGARTGRGMGYCAGYNMPGYANPGFGRGGGFGRGRGFGWQRRGKFKDTIKEAQGKGPEGCCICSKCGYKIEHERGVPCSTIKCPKCKINLTRE